MDVILCSRFQFPDNEYTPHVLLMIAAEDKRKRNCCTEKRRHIMQILFFLLFLENKGKKKIKCLMAAR
jgi:hypothetical protein